MLTYLRHLIPIFHWFVRCKLFPNTSVHWWMQWQEWVQRSWSKLAKWWLGCLRILATFSNILVRFCKALKRRIALDLEKMPLFSSWKILELVMNDCLVNQSVLTRILTTVSWLVCKWLELEVNVVKMGEWIIVGKCSTKILFWCKKSIPEND